MNLCNIYRLDALGFAITNILNDICREMSLYIYSPELAIYEHKKAYFGTHISAMLSYLYIQLLFIFRPIYMFYRWPYKFFIVVHTLEIEQRSSNIAMY